MTAQAEANLQACLDTFDYDGLLRRVAMRLEQDADRSSNPVMHAVYSREAKSLRITAESIRSIK